MTECEHNDKTIVKKDAKNMYFECNECGEDVTVKKVKVPNEKT